MDAIDLATFDDAELQELGHAVVDEMARRLELEAMHEEVRNAVDTGYPTQTHVDHAEKRVLLCAYDLDAVDSGAQCLFIPAAFGPGSLRGYKLADRDMVLDVVVVTHHSDRAKHLIQGDALEPTCERLGVSEIADITQVWIRETVRPE